MTTIEVRGLTKRFGATVAVEDLSFDVPVGRVVGFLGPNGAGKTTTLRSLLGLVEPTSGTATFDGTRYADLPDPTRLVGAVLESSSFHPKRSGRDHLRVIAVTTRTPAARVDEVLDLVGLTRDAGRSVDGYSLGMKQRLSLAAALLRSPEILVLDEPANGLDPGGMHWLRAFLRRHAAEGGSVLVSSHVLGEVAQTVDDVVIVGRGRLVRAGPIGELTGEGDRSVHVRSPDAERLGELLVKAGATLTPDETGSTVRGISSEQIGELAAQHGLVLHELSPTVTSLEDIFLRLTGSGGAAA
jgi:ABC-2 type transport system ATP-binding protein